MDRFLKGLHGSKAGFFALRLVTRSIANNIYQGLRVMKIKSLEYKNINIEMKKPFKIALGSTDFYEGYFVKVTTDSGLSGYGEAIPTPFITGDTMGSVESELSIFSQALKGMDLSTEALNERMKALARSSKASRAAVDMALYDIIGKKADLPLYILLGGYRTSMKTSYTVDLVDAPHAKVQAKELLDDGVEFFKIKLGKSINEDYERVKAVREVIGSEHSICVDFNQSYSPKKAVDLSGKIEKFGIEFLEQPVDRDDVKGMKFVRLNSSIPVMADEAVFTLADLSNVVYEEAADYVNIKLMKCGGITDALKIVKAAQVFRMPCMMGCMVETKLANTAGLHVALAQPNFAYTDLDGFSSLKEPGVSGGLTFVKGINHPPKEGGIGATPIMAF